MMNIHRLTTTNLPSIRIHDHQNPHDSDEYSSHSQRSLPRDIPFKSSSPTSIRGSLQGPESPPPLLSIHPLVWDRGDDSRTNTPMTPSDTWESAGSSILGGYMSRQDNSRGGWGNARAEDGFVGEARNGINNLQLKERLSNSLSNDHQVGVTMKSSMDSYDKNLLRKLKPATALRNPRSPLSPSPLDDPRTGYEFDSQRIRAGYNSAPAGFNLAPTSSPIPIGSRPSDSPMTRWAHSNTRTEPFSSRTALAPGVPPVFPTFPLDYRTPASDRLSVCSFGPDDSSDDRKSVNGSACEEGRDRDRERVLRPRRSYEPVLDIDQDLQMEDIPSSNVSRMRHLTLDTASVPRPNSYPVAVNPSQRTGSKRRASSPPVEDRQMGQIDHRISNDTARRSPNGVSTPTSRYSPSSATRYHPATNIHNSSYPRSGSSFASSTGTGWTNSLAGSSLASVASSFSTDRFSPAASYSPASEHESVTESPYKSHSSVPPSRRPNDVRTPTEVNLPVVKHEREREREQLSGKTTPMPKTNGPYMCDCCPKKPKKFDNEADLRLHAMEKQYTCSYCNNRFKNKNEAERHQNSLHLRKHSWSCAALSGVEAAFHPSAQRPNLADVCGYCGKEFPNPANWEIRSEHLNNEHKFGECNQAKKFFRADHFRQHLKHSHSGMAGKWTNVLENACMRDEPGVICEE